MFKFDNTHIFTGYLKQLLSSFNLPTCKIYTKEFVEYLENHGKEDPRVLESFDAIEYAQSKKRAGVRFSYLRGTELYGHFWTHDKNKPNLNHDNCSWRRVSSVFYNPDSSIPGLTRTLNSRGSAYDTITHEHLGEYLRFMRDYYDINLMSMYNCFNNKLCNNINYTHKIKIANPNFDKNAEKNNSPEQIELHRTFDSRDSRYRIYAIPVKLFSNYTIAIDCNTEIEMFCGFYKTSLEYATNVGSALIANTYQKINKTLFKQPFLYDKLSVKYWNFETDSRIVEEANQIPAFADGKTITRWDVASREQDLRLFIKVPTSCKSSIVILEGDYRGFNDFQYFPVQYNNGNNTRTVWDYRQNHFVINFDNKPALNKSTLVPISKLQLLAFNTGESYPFADRLVEYLTHSAITPIDEISDNIKRAQAVMNQNQYYFKTDGLWENKMQKIIYDYIMNVGPIRVEKNAEGKDVLVDSRRGYQPRLGYSSKSNLYDILGYIDKDAEKWYASWTIENGQAKIRDNIQNVDIYNGLYDI